MANSKIKSLSQLKKITQQIKNRGKQIVFTNGCFDIIHVGHIKYLEKAAKYGDVLIIAVNSDKSVKTIKGKTRPFNKQLERAYILSAFSFVDYVIIFNEKTPHRLIKSLKPDVLVKGGDWPKSKIIGRSTVKKYGGKVINIPFVKGFSTTKLIQRIRLIL